MSGSFKGSKGSKGYKGRVFLRYAYTNLSFI